MGRNIAYTASMKNAHIKTAISLPATLLDQVDELASELEVSRSRLFALAAEQYLQRHENEKFLRALNAVYGVDDPQEREVRLQHKRKHRKRVAGQW